MFGRASREQRAYREQITQYRRRKDQFFGSPNSPIPYADRHHGFSGLAYYPPDPVFRVQARLVPFGALGLVRLATSTGELRQQMRYGELQFHLAGQAHRLTAFVDPHDDHRHELFVPFRDATSGRETYGAGRYLEVAIPHEHGPGHGHGHAHAAAGVAEGTPMIVVLDFNLAYNPYCAYANAYSCPVPPAENTLPIAITAGERAFNASHQ